MSRAFRRVKDGWVRRDRPKPITPAWAIARGIRRIEREGIPQQSRNKEGFIPKTDPATGASYLHDPGDIDRFLWTLFNSDTAEG